MRALPGGPEAVRRPLTLTQHGIRRVDDYHWLRERTNPEVLTHLEAENAHTAAVMEPLAPLRVELYEEMRSRVLEVDSSAPVAKAGFLRYARFEADRQYPIHCRRRQGSDAEEVVLDVNRLAAGLEYCDVTAVTYSPDQCLLAYAVDTDGQERYSITVKDLRDGSSREELTEVVAGVVWAADGRSFYYTMQDATERAHRVCRHRLGTAGADDELVFEEDDARFHVDIALSCTERFLVISSRSKSTSEQRLVDLRKHHLEPLLVAPRRQGVRYEVADWGDELFIRTNDGAPNFRIARAELGNSDRAAWQEYRSDRPEVTVLELRTFAAHLAVVERGDGLNRVRIIDLVTGQEHTVAFDELDHVVELGDNLEFATSVLRLDYTSLLTPPTQLDYDMATRDRTVVKRREVPGYEPSAYETRRVEAVAADGVRVPISLLSRRSGTEGPRPLLLEGYGSYGLCYEPRFEAHRICLADRGVAVALAHIRGGGEFGEDWRVAGNMARKRTTFTDFISCAEALIEAGHTTADQLAISGRSAGGLLIGAVLNLRPELFRAAVAGVPFVDVVTTMSDPSIPLTTAEYEEWGDPADREAFEYMLSYSPYDNVRAVAYPWMLVTAGLHDPRVSYWEPAKWVAKLRLLKTDGHPLLLQTNLGKGHFAFTGRFERLQERALELAFILAALGAAQGAEAVGAVGEAAGAVTGVRAPGNGEDDG